MLFGESNRSLGFCEGINFVLFFKVWMRLWSIRVGGWLDLLEIFMKNKEIDIGF